MNYQEMIDKYSAQCLDSIEKGLPISVEMFAKIAAMHAFLLHPELRVSK